MHTKCFTNLPISYPIKVPLSLMRHTDVAVSLCNIVVCARSGETVAEPPCDTGL